MGNVRAFGQQPRPDEQEHTGEFYSQDLEEGMSVAFDEHLSHEDVAARVDAATTAVHEASQRPAPARPAASRPIETLVSQDPVQARLEVLGRENAKRTEHIARLRQAGTKRAAELQSQLEDLIRQQTLLQEVMREHDRALADKEDQQRLLIASNEDAIKRLREGMLKPATLLAAPRSVARRSSKKQGS